MAVEYDVLFDAMACYDASVGIPIVARRVLAELRRRGLRVLPFRLRGVAYPGPDDTEAEEVDDEGLAALARRCRVLVTCNPVLFGYQHRLPAMRSVAMVHDLIPSVLWDEPVPRLEGFTKLACISRTTLRDVQRLLPHAPAVLTPHHFEPRPVPDPYAHLPMLPKTYVLWMYGALCGRKRFDLALDVLDRLPPAYHLVVPCESRASLHRYQRGLGNRVVVLERPSDGVVDVLYRDAAAVLVTSMYEGFGLPLLEAIAAGRPLVAFDVPGVSEVAEGCAALVPFGDVEAAARAVLRAQLPDPRRAAETLARYSGHAFVDLVCDEVAAFSAGVPNGDPEQDAAGGPASA